jgi:hypothetical protein
MPYLVAVTHLNEPSLSPLQADFMGFSGNMDGVLFNNMYKDRPISYKRYIGFERCIERQAQRNIKYRGINELHEKIL